MFLYRPTFIPTNFVVIGAGGTGSRLVPLLSQFIKTAGWIQNPTIYVVDFDAVEEKNLVRQNFIKLDLGKNKATVLASRYGPAFDVNIVAVPKKVNSLTDKALSSADRILTLDPNTSSATLHGLQNAIIIMCVDSAQARRDILTHFTQSRNTLIIDAGNENDYGQVVLFNPVSHNPSGLLPYEGDLQKHLTIDGNKLVPVDCILPFIPIPTQMYVEMKDIKSASCADLDQTLAINAMMATTMMGIIQNFIYSKPIAYHRINVDLAHGSIPEYIDIPYLAKFAIHGSKYHKGDGVPNFPYMSLDDVYEKLSRDVDAFKRKLNKPAPKLEETTDSKKAKKKKAIEGVSILDNGITPIPSNITPELIDSFVATISQRV